MNAATTPILNTAEILKHHSDDIETHIKSIEDKLICKIAALKSYFYQRHFWLEKRYYVTKIKKRLQIIRKTK